MQDTGIIRRIDELGRVVIPKELRKKLRIKEGDPLEIYTDENQMVLKKYSPMAEVVTSAQSVADGLNSILEKGVIVTDNDEIIAVSGIKDITLPNEITAGIERAIKERKNVIISRPDGGTIIPVIKNGQSEAENQVIVPILANGDCYGSVILLDSDKYYRFTTQEVKLARLGASFLSVQFED